MVPGLVVMALIVIPYFKVNIEAEGLFLKNRVQRLRIFYSVATGLSLFLLFFKVYAALVPTLIMIGVMLFASQGSPESPTRWLRYLAGRPLSYWVMTWFLFELIVLTAIGTLFRGPGWAPVCPWWDIVRGKGDKETAIMKEKLRSLWKTLFGDSVRAFGVVSLLFLGSMAIAPAKNFFSEWRHYQNGYRSMIRNRSEANTLQRHFQSGIQQIWLPEQGVVDRCTSCHVGLKEPSLTDVATQPYRKHPAIPHNLDQFGCTVCHRGQGAATTVTEAHSSTLAWEQPLLPAKYIESGCGQCHHSPMPGTPQLESGRNLLSREGCVHCHTVKLPDGSTMKASDDPPSLSHIADKTSREWVYAWLKDPQAYASTATMPNFKLSDDDARDISAFLIANSKPLEGDTATLAAKASSDPAAGASLYGESFCASCHAVQNAAGNMVGGDVGPELTKVGSKVKPEWLQAWLRNPRVYDPATAMSHYRFSDPQIATLAGFLLAKSDADLLANVHLDAATPEQITRGKRLVSDYGCASCHEIAGIKKPENFAPELSRIGSKPVTQLVFLPGMEHTLPDYIAGKIKQPRAFSPGLKMPQYTFTTPQIDTLTTALLSLNDRSTACRQHYRWRRIRLELPAGW